MKSTDVEYLIRMLERHGITKLYHATDIANWGSIHSLGIYSLDELNEYSITPESYGNDRLSRRISINKGLSQYVHLSFTPNPLFLETSSKIDSNKKYITIEVDPRILAETDFVVSDIDPLNEKSSILDGVNFIGKIDELIRKQTLQESVILIPKAIPVSYISNAVELNQLYNSRNPIRRDCVIFAVDLSSSMMGKVNFDSRIYSNGKDAAIAILNKTISSILNASVDKNGINDHCDICIVGFSDGQSPSLENHESHASFMSLHSLYREMVRRLTIDGTKTQWVSTNQLNKKCLTLSALNAHIKTLALEWMVKNGNGNPPLIVFVSNGLSLSKFKLPLINGLQSIRDVPCFKGANNIISCFINTQTPCKTTDYSEQYILMKEINGNRPLVDLTGDLSIAINNYWEQFNLSSK